jgi:hypothetical protein
MPPATVPEVPQATMLLLEMPQVGVPAKEGGNRTHSSQAGYKAYRTRRYDGSGQARSIVTWRIEESFWINVCFYWISTGAHQWMFPNTTTAAQKNKLQKEKVHIHLWKNMLQKQIVKIREIVFCDILLLLLRSVSGVHSVSLLSPVL